MLMDDINSNRHCVQSVFTRLDDAQDKDDALSILKQLIREELLSAEQYEKLAELEDLDLPTVAMVIMDSKNGQGLKFLPRTIGDLSKSLHSFLTELPETGNSVIRNKLTAVRGTPTTERNLQ